VSCGGMRDGEMKTGAPEALYIKLGEGGNWAGECIETKALRLGFGKVPHGLASEGRWEDVKKLLQASEQRGRPADITRQVRKFYESSEDVLWITFHKNRLWWCRSERHVTPLADRPGGASRSRAVIGEWRCEDATGTPLDVSRLSGKLLSLQGYQGTICAVREREYLLRKINAESLPEIKAALEARGTLAEAIEPIVRNLRWRDFEILVDMMFRQAGWKRVGELGGTQEGTDLVLEAPITNERHRVQVKSQAGIAQLEAFTQKLDPEEVGHAYFVVHSPTSDLDQYEPDGEAITLLRIKEIAEWSVKYGLVDWIIDKAG
jgi:hypothetical protein